MTAAPPREDAGPARLAAWVGAAGFLALGALLFPSAGRDDVHIAYWSAWTLEHFGALLNYSGEPLEQGSSVLHVVLLALLATLSGVGVEHLGTPLSALFGALAAVQAARLGRVLDPRAGPAAGLLAISATPLLYWSFGALEASFVAFLVAGLVQAMVTDLAAAVPRRPYASMAWAALYVAARPEGIFVMAAFVSAAAVLQGRDRQALRRLAPVAAATLAAFAALAAWRWLTFEALFPQPVAAKIDAHVGTKLAAGLRYYLRALVDFPAFAALATLAAAPLLRGAARGDFSARGPWLAAAFLAALGAFVLTSGGDWMEGSRFLVPAVPLVAALGARALQDLPGRAGGAILAVLLVACVAQAVSFAARRSTSVPLPYAGRTLDWARAQGVALERYALFELLNRVHLRDAIFIPHLESVVDALLRTQPIVTVMSAQGGMVPFYVYRSRFGRLRFVDAGGLTSRDLERCGVLSRNPLTRGAGGISLSDTFYLQHMDAFRTECGIEFPDVYFNVDYRRDQLAAALEATGRYRVVHVQSGDLCVPGVPCPPAVNGNMVLAVRAGRGGPYNASP